MEVYFIYDVSPREKLKFEEIINHFKGKLKLWNCRNLTIMGRIQIVKTFLVPLIMCRAGSTGLDKKSDQRSQ